MSFWKKTFGFLQRFEKVVIKLEFWNLDLDPHKILQLCFKLRQNCLKYNKLLKFKRQLKNPQMQNIKSLFPDKDDVNN